MILESIPYKHMLFFREEGEINFSIIYQLEIDSRVVLADKVEVSAGHVIANFGDAKIIDEINFSDGIVTIQRQWNIKAQTNASLFFSVMKSIIPKNWIVPGVMYNGNKEGFGKFPVGDTSVGWSFREDRCTIPSCSIIEWENGFLALFTRPAESERYISSIMTTSTKSQTTLSIRIPYVEFPRSHTGLRYIGYLNKKTSKSILVNKSITYKREFFIIFGKNQKRSYAYVCRKAWEILAFAPKESHNWQELACKKIANLLKVFFIRRPDAIGFIESIGKSLLPISPVLSSAGRGGNISIAYCLYKSSLENEMLNLKKIAFDIADFFLEGALENGLFYADYHLFYKRWFGNGFKHSNIISATSLGSACYNYLCLFNLAKEKEEIHDNWLQFCKKCLDFLEVHQGKNGNYGSLWDNEGRLLSNKGASGAIIIPAMIELYKITLDSRYLTSAQRAADFFINYSLEKDVYFTENIDSSCIDRDGASLLLKALISLYRVTREEKYLKSAIKVAEYLTTWIFSYNVTFSKKSPLGKRSFRTQGGTQVSVQRHHLDYSGIEIALDFLRLWKETADEIWKDYAISLTDFCYQLISNPNDNMGYPSFFVGYQPEQILHTNWDSLSSSLFRKGHFKKCASWVDTIILRTLFDLKTEFSEMFNFTIPPFSLEETLSFKIAKHIQYVASYLNFF